MEYTPEMERAHLARYLLPLMAQTYKWGERDCLSLVGGWLQPMLCSNRSMTLDELLEYRAGFPSEAKFYSKNGSQFIQGKLDLHLSPRPVEQRELGDIAYWRGAMGIVGFGGVWHWCADSGRLVCSDVAPDRCYHRG